jgi:hypothetical protein
MASQAKTSMVGMTKEKVLACMGPPAQQATVGETEVWSYPSGGDTESFASASANSFGQGNLFASSAGGFGSGTVSSFGHTNAFGSSETEHRYCVVNVVMAGGKVSAVNYSGRTGGWASQGEQCAFAVQNCVQSP